MTPAYHMPTSYVYGDTTMALTLNGRDREDIAEGTSWPSVNRSA